MFKNEVQYGALLLAMVQYKAVQREMINIINDTIIKLTQRKTKFQWKKIIFKQKLTMDDDAFDFEELSPEEQNEMQSRMREERKKLEKHPLIKQANEILKIVDTLLDTCSDEAFADRYGSTLRESALIIVVKLNSLVVSDNYLVSMQNAALIREHGQYLRLANHSLNAFNVFDKKYVTLFREEMETFRLLFKDFAAGIHQLEKTGEDEWGLFL